MTPCCLKMHLFLNNEKAFRYQTYDNQLKRKKTVTQHQDKNNDQNDIHVLIIYPRSIQVLFDGLYKRHHKLEDFVAIQSIDRNNNIHSLPKL